MTDKLELLRQRLVRRADGYCPSAYQDFDLVFAEIKQLQTAGKELNQLIRNTAGVKGWEISPSIAESMEVFN